MTDTNIKQIAKDFESLNGYPLKSDVRIKTFTSNDKQKLTFLESFKEFDKQHPNLNYYELGKEIERNSKKNRNFIKRFEGLVDFINKPDEAVKALDKMLTGYKNKQDLQEDINENYRPQRFEVVEEEDKVIYVIPPASKKTKKPASGESSASDIKEVVSPPRMRGSKAAKEMKEEAQKKERNQPIQDITQRVEALETDVMGNVLEDEDSPAVFDPSELTTEELEELTGMTREQIELNRKGKNIDTDDDDDEDEEKEEERPQPRRPPETAIPAVISTDQRDQEQTKAEAEEKRKSDIATMTLGKGSATGKVEEKEIQDIPQDIRAIPKERGSTTGKSEAQLKDDLNYFFKTYPDMLKKQKGQYMTILRGKSPALRKKQLIELHRRIVGLVGNVEDVSKDIGKQIGIVLNADKYLDDKINAILLDKITQGMTAAQLVVDVTDKTKDDKSKRIGSYQITKGRSGLLNAQKAPVYRSIPTTNDSQDRRSGRPIKLKTLPTQRWDEVNTAKKQMRLDPFEPKRNKVNRFDIYL